MSRISTKKKIYNTLLRLKKLGCFPVAMSLREATLVLSLDLKVEFSFLDKRLTFSGFDLISDSEEELNSKLHKIC